MITDPSASTQRIGYVVKRYPRFSETFIVNEILAHEASGLEIEIFSIRPCNDTHFQDRLAEVRAPLTQLDSARPKANLFWDQLRAAPGEFPNLWDVVSQAQHADVVSIQQGIELARIIRERGITHLHAHFATLPATVASLAAQLAEVTFSLTAHAKDIFHESVSPQEIAAKLHAAAAVVTVSQFNVDHFHSEYCLPSDKVHRVYNGLDVNRLPFQSPEHREPTILGIGRLVEKKGFDDLIRACAALDQREISFHCQIVGGGDLEQQLRDLIMELDVRHCVELTGPIPQKQLKQLIHQASLVAAPCVVGNDGNRDGLPTVILEAMALGTPCVATPVTGIPEVIRHEDTGLIVPDREPEKLAGAMQHLLTDATLRCDLARRARNVIDQHFDSRATSKQLREIFRRCTSATRENLPVLQEQL